MSKVSLPQGTRDFDAATVRRRNYIFSVIRDVFERFGFQPLETPAMENMETLMGKYGDEGDKLIFRILNNGLERPEKHAAAREAFEKLLSGKNSVALTERALRYDLTIPFARYVVMNQGKLNFPFKRYQIQPVWRADRPQRGRYREFYQCDADVIGSNSLINEVELANIYHQAFTGLGIKDYTLKVNSRKMLVALAEKTDGDMRVLSAAIDKLDKKSREEVMLELSTKGFSKEALDLISRYLNVSGSNKEKLEAVKEIFPKSAIAEKALEELNVLLSPELMDNGIRLEIDFTLARGLDYYTGIIFEVKAPPTVKMGSIGGGGRYDDLTGLFGVKDISGVGISFGVDRIYDVMDELGLFPADVETGTRVLFMNMDVPPAQVYKLLRVLRERKISCEYFPDLVKIDKQFRYAEKRNIPFAIIIGSREVDGGSCVIKDLRTGVQQTILQRELADFNFE